MVDSTAGLLLLGTASIVAVTSVPARPPGISRGLLDGIGPSFGATRSKVFRVYAGRSYVARVEPFDRPAVVQLDQKVTPTSSAVVCASSRASGSTLS
jgi:hypothetical protein